MPKRLSLVVVCLFAVSLPAVAATRTWTGAISNRWAEPGNWSPAGLPAPDDALVFPYINAAAAVDLVNDLPVGTRLGPISITTTYRMSGNELLLTGNVGGTLSSTAPVKLGASITMDSPRVVSLDVNGYTLTIQPRGLAYVGSWMGKGVVNSGARVQTTASGNFSGTLTSTDFQFGLPNGDMPQMPNADIVSSFTGNGAIGNLTVPATGSLHPDGTIAWNMSFGSLSTKSINIQGGLFFDLVGGGAGDTISATGSVTLAGPLTVNVPAGALAVGQEYTIIDNQGSGAVNGTFKDLPEGSTIHLGPADVMISYRGGTGNDVVLRVTHAPNTWTGGVSGNWSDRRNWSMNVVPAAGETVAFAPLAPNRTITNDVDGLRTGGLIFEDEYILTGKAVTLGGDVQFAAPQLRIASNAVIPTSAGITCDAPLTIGADVKIWRGDTTLFRGGVDVNGHTVSLFWNYFIPSFEIPPDYFITLDGPLTGTGAIVTSGTGLTTAGGTFSGTVTGSLDLHGSLAAARFTDTTTFFGGGTLGDVVVNPGGKLYVNAPLSVGALTMNGVFLPNYILTARGAVTLSGTLVWNQYSSARALIDNVSSLPVSGTFAGLPEGAGVINLVITYQGGDGNDVFLTPLRLTMTQSSSTSRVGEPVTFTVTASPAVASGTVTCNGDGFYGKTVPMQNGVASLTIPLTVVGTNIITCGGASVQHVVTRLPTVTRVVPTATSFPLSTLASFNVTVVAPGSPARPIGIITMQSDGHPIGQINAPGGSFSVGTLTEGQHLITATYGGGTDYEPSSSDSVTITIGAAPPVTAVLTQSSQTSRVGDLVTFTFTVSATSTSGTVAFSGGGLDGRTATLQNGAASLVAPLTTVGTNVITASAGGATASVTHAVTRIATATHIVPAAASFPVSTLASFTVTVDALPPAVTVPGPPGTIMLQSDGVAIGTIAAPGGVVRIGTLQPGRHLITAVYDGGANYEGSSDAVYVTIGSTPPAPPSRGRAARH